LISMISLLNRIWIEHAARSSHALGARKFGVGAGRSGRMLMLPPLLCDARAACSQTPTPCAAYTMILRRDASSATARRPVAADAGHSRRPALRAGSEES
jgi:hypothetical protein